MSQSNKENISQLIFDAPLGQYIGIEGSKTLAENSTSAQELKDDENLYRSGDVADSFFMITSGRIALVTENSDGSNRYIIHVLEKGDMLGELSFIDKTPRTVSAYALGNTALLCFHADDINPLVISHPRLVFDFMRAVIKRVHSTVTSISRQQKELSNYIATGGSGRL
jgi:CRP/FNR family cyclic AMP-dependent transcriptional regulator